MLENSNVIGELQALVAGLKDNGFIDIIEVEDICESAMEYKVSIENRSLDLLKKWLEVNLLIQAMSSGSKIPIYACGPITNKAGWSVLHLRIEHAGRSI